MSNDLFTQRQQVADTPASKAVRAELAALPLLPENEQVRAQLLQAEANHAIVYAKRRHNNVDEKIAVVEAAQVLTDARAAVRERIEPGKLDW